MSGINDLEKYVKVLLPVAIIVILIPSLGSEVETSMPVNSTSSFANATTGGEFYDKATIGLGIAALLTGIGIALRGSGMLGKKD